MSIIDFLVEFLAVSYLIAFIVGTFLYVINEYLVKRGWTKVPANRVHFVKKLRTGKIKLYSEFDEYSTTSIFGNILWYGKELVCETSKSDLEQFRLRFSDGKTATLFVKRDLEKLFNIYQQKFGFLHDEEVNVELLSNEELEIYLEKLDVFDNKSSMEFYPSDTFWAKNLESYLSKKLSEIKNFSSKEAVKYEAEKILAPYGIQIKSVY